MQHVWTEQDDIAALYLYKFGDRPNVPPIDSVAREKGMSAESLRRRIENFRYLDTGSGLAHFARQSETVFRKHAELSSAVLRELAGL